MDDGSAYIEFDVPEFSNTVLNQLNDLRLQGKLCDIIVHIQGQPFRAHKAVLAASSPYFRDHSALGTMSGLSISVIKNPDVFEQLLAFCYTGRMSLQLKDVISFLTAASFLQMQAVIDKCTQILEGIHSKISSATSPDEGSQASRNGVKDSSLFINPTQISPPYYSRHSIEARSELAAGKGHGRARHQEEGQSDRGSSDGVSEQEAATEGETEQVELIGKDGQVTDVHAAGYTYSGLSSPCFVSLSSSSPSRSMLSGFRGGRARAKRPPVAERSLRSQWYPYNERLLCIYCGKSFNQKGSLDRHMRLHMGITPFVCKFCGKKYTRKDQLEYHIRGHTDNKPFHCQICGKCFPFQGTLNQHLRKKHLGATEGTNHMDSPERTEGSSGQKDPEDASEGMVFETQYVEEAPATDMEESSKCSPEEAQASRYAHLAPLSSNFIVLKVEASTL
ncbi:unnamed protein product [Oncorhynchus mykiss]|uniref:Zinc finger and BTB domain-containing protein 34 n=1 Tax=Oncorhynchus mykiss TaxID=8022 RepID=A0A060VPJ4_ONCMY|nr:unnamed protein product [Oncorhynchus mykiss]